jgi:hypothetical protein
MPAPTLSYKRQDAAITVSVDAMDSNELADVVIGFFLGHPNDNQLIILQDLRDIMAGRIKPSPRATAVADLMRAAFRRSGIVLPKLG